MKHLLLLLFVYFHLLASAQTKNDTIELVQETSSLFDLEFSNAEADSMLSGIKELNRDIKNLHKVLPSNDLPYPFAFQPAPAGYVIPKDQKKINWIIPSNVSLPADKNDLAYYSILQLASLIKNKKISSVDLTKFFLDRLKKWNDSLFCVITFTEELAMKQAKQADEDLKKGIYKGPLHGIPYGLKDLFAVKGYKTTYGSAPYKEQEINDNAFVFEQLTKAGAVHVAKLSLGALAFNDLWFGGRTNNPWNFKQGSSGSSAGSASATSAGLLPFAIGTETWGSIISPSTRCGVTGLRPTFGSTSRSAAMVLSWSLDKVGPITRSAEDCAIVFAAIKGTDGEDPSAINYAFNYNPSGDVKKLRIAYAENYFTRLPKDGNDWKVIETFKSMGINPIPVTFPDSALYQVDLMNFVISSEAAAAFDELTRTNRDDLIERQDKGFWPNIFRTARLIPAVEYINANRQRTKLMSGLNDFMKNYDVVIVPSFAGNQLAMTNLTGHPVVCLPNGFSRSGTPTSISFLGNLYDEASILLAAKVFQLATDHEEQRPPLITGK